MENIEVTKIENAPRAIPFIIFSNGSIIKLN
jgi:hypothetical protein